jgi:acyl carrier protein
MNTTFERLSHLLVQHYKLAPERLSMEAPLETLGIDSLGTVELLWSIEDSFLIKMPTDAVNLLTLGDVVRYIDELMAAQSVATPPAEGHPQPQHTA